MGKTDRVHRDRAKEAAHQARRRSRARLAGGLPAVRRGHVAPAGRAMHGLRHPVLSPGLPAREPDSGLERPGLQRPLADGHRTAGRDQQLPRVHRAAVPRAVRRRVRARHQQRPGDHQGDRERDHRARVRRGMDRAAPAGASHRQAHRRRRLGPGGAGRGRSAEQSRAPGHRVRARRSHRRPAAVRHSRVQDGEARPRSTSVGHGSAKASGSGPTPTSAATFPPTNCSASSTRLCWPAARRFRATCPFPDGSSPASTSRWST